MSFASVLNQAAAIITGYLLGSIPSAFIISCTLTGKAIRGNPGILNTYKSLGIKAAVLVGVMDLGKAAAAVIIAFSLLKVSPLFVMLAGLAAVAGHMWMVFMKFHGGRGMASALGGVVTLFTIYGHWPGAAAFSIIIIGTFTGTRNVPFAMSVAMFFLPLITWLSTHSWQAVILAIVLGLIIGGKFYSTARRDWLEAGSLKKYIFRNIRGGNR